MQKFNVKKLNEAEGEKQYCIETPNRLAALKKWDKVVDVNRTRETIRENIRNSAKKYKFLWVEER
jgi:hypothetical protein